MSDIPERRRVVTWGDPMLAAQAVPTMSGREFLEAIKDGSLPPPPIASVLGMTPAEVDEGRVVFTMTPQEFHYNPIGVVHGGVISTLLDTSMACAIQTTIPKGMAYTSLEIKVNFIRALKVTTGEVRCEGKVIHRGGMTATAEGRITDAAGKLYAHGTTTCILFRL